jgi:hypothetical protein
LDGSTASPEKDAPQPQEKMEIEQGQHSVSHFI